MNTGSDGIELIQHFESCVLKAYYDKHGRVWTIGWGSTGPDIKAGTVWTQEQADRRFFEHLEEFEDLLDAHVYVSLAQNEYDALVSFIYNVGPGMRGVKDGLIQLKNGNQSTLLKRVLAHDRMGAANEFRKWNRAGGVELAGLTRRRNAEAALYLGDNWRQYLR